MECKIDKKNIPNLCNKIGNIYMFVSETGYDLKDFSDKYLLNKLPNSLEDINKYKCLEDYLNYIIENLDIKLNEDIKCISSECAFFIGYTYYYLYLFTENSGEILTEKLPFDYMLIKSYSLVTEDRETAAKEICKILNCPV